MVPNELGDFLLPVFIDKDEGVMMRVTSIVFMPSFPRMDGIFIIADRDVRQCVKSFKECFWLLLVLGVIWVNEVGEGGNIGEVCDAVVLLVCDREGDRSIVFSHCLDEGFKVLCDHIDVVIYRWVGCFVTDDGFAKHDGVVNLGLGRVYCLKDRDPDSFDLRRGRGEAREVILNLTGGGCGSCLANISF